MDLLIVVALFGASFVAAAINSVAGGGTFLTFPLLIFAGQTSIAANIISSIALWPGAIASMFAYRHIWMKMKSVLPKLLFASLIGAGAGAVVLLLTPEVQFRALVPYLMLIAALLFTFGPTVLKRFRHPTEHLIIPTAGICALQMVIGFYGGYFGAGMGILMLAMLQLMGMGNIHEMNALKSVLGSAVNAIAVVYFVINATIEWDITIIMLIGGVLGGYFGTKTALRFSPQTMRIVVMIIAWTMTLYFLLF